MEMKTGGCGAYPRGDEHVANKENTFGIWTNFMERMLWSSCGRLPEMIPEPKKHGAGVICNAKVLELNANSFGTRRPVIILLCAALRPVPDVVILYHLVQLCLKTLLPCKVISLRRTASACRWWEVLTEVWSFEFSK